MTMGRRIAKCKGSSYTKTVMPHAEFIDRIRKSLYFGYETRVNEMEEMSRPLADLASEIFSEPHKGHSLNRLNTVTAGKVHATPCSLIMALIYLDRINSTDPGYVRRITPQELFIVSMMISTKFYIGYDEEIYLSDWAADGNMSEDRLKQLELEFLCAIDWKIYISNEEFFAKLSNIEKILARREGLRRGWLTYNELIEMLPTFTVAKFLLKNITVMAISYAASVMTIAGAFFLASQVPGTLLHRKTITTASVNEGTSAIESSNDIMPTPPIVRNRNPNSNDTTIDADVIDVNGSNVTTTVMPQPNATCRHHSSLNVELELLKLEAQYRKDAEREELRHRNNELISDNRLTLPNAVQQQQLQLTECQTAGDRRRSFEKLNWNTMKKEKLNEITTVVTMERKQLNIPSAMQTTQAATTTAPTTTKNAQMINVQLSKYFADWSNGTSSLFWQLLSTDRTFIHLALPWYKLI